MFVVRLGGGASISHVEGEANHHDANASSRNGTLDSRGDGRVVVLLVRTMASEVLSEIGTKHVGFAGG
jgi:hypothetical protein